MKLITSLVAAMVFSTVLAAQDGPRRGRRGGGEDGERQRGPKIEQLATLLQLTEDQVTQLGEIQAEQRTAMMENMRAAAQKRREAQESLKSDNPDAGLIGRLLVEAEQAQASGKATRAQFNDRSRAVLNDSQLAALAQLQSVASMQGELRQAVGLGLIDVERGEGPGPGAFRGRGAPGGPGAHFGGRGGPGRKGGPGGRGGRRGGPPSDDAQ